LEIARMKGRKPKATVLKDLHGSEQPRNPDEPVNVIDLDASTAPEHFDEDQRQVWDTVLANAPPGMLKAIDAGTLEVWVVAHCMHRKAVRAQARFGLVIPAPNTRLPIQSPYIPIINRQGLIMLRAAAELGFSPTSRPRVGITLGGGDLSGATKHDAATAEESLDRYLHRSPASEALN
jgi:P27 family predicted phage terminase small subunit